MSYQIQPFVDMVEAILASHSLGQPGAYRRWNWQKGERAAQGSGVSTQPPFAGQRDLGLNPYGCADAANLLYTIHHFPRDPGERAGWVRVLRGMQDPDSGLYTEATHYPLHTTAHCLAALELFDAGPLYPLAGLAELREPAAMEAFLEGLDWKARPWTESHKGAGLYAALTLAGEAGAAWQERYFAWLARENDPATGFWRRGQIEQAEQSGLVSRFPYLAGSFHYLFNHEDAHMPLAHPAALVDTCLELRRSDPFPLGSSVGFAEIDWVYCLTRAARQSGQRSGEVRAALGELVEQYVPYLLGLDAANDDGLNDLHQLFGTACALAELQSALPGMLKTERPLRLVLDRRPFI